MPVNLSVKNVPDNIVAGIREQAKRHHRSLQGELLVILEEILQPNHLSPEEAYKQIKNLPLKTGAESLKMIREDRDVR